MKKRSLILISNLMVFLVGCSSGGENGSAGGVGGTGTGGTAPQGAGATPLTKQPWCVSAQAENGQKYLVRIEFRDDKSVRYTEFDLSADGSRGEVHEDERGTYTLSGNRLAVMLKGVPILYQVRLDPSPETGARRLWIDQTAHDPCL